MPYFIRDSQNGTKTRTERAGVPAFSTVVEVLSYDKWRIHTSTSRAVDSLLAGGRPFTQVRRFDGDGRMLCRFKAACGAQCFSARADDCKRPDGDLGIDDAVPEWLQHVHALARRG